MKGNVLNASETSKGVILGSAHMHSNKEWLKSEVCPEYCYHKTLYLLW